MVLSLGRKEIDDFLTVRVIGELIQNSLKCSDGYVNGTNGNSLDVMEAFIMLILSCIPFIRKMRCTYYLCS